MRFNSCGDRRPVLDGKTAADNKVRRMLDRMKSPENLRSMLISSCRIAWENSGEPTVYGRQYWEHHAQRLETLLETYEGSAGNLRIGVLKAKLGMLDS